MTMSSVGLSGIFYENSGDSTQDDSFMFLLLERGEWF